MSEHFLTDQENHLNFDTSQVHTVLDLLCLREKSDHTALICGEEKLSYRQLAEDAKRIARCLLSQGLQKGDRVLLIVKNSIHVVRAMFGILLAGGVYVAADAGWPADRLRQVSEEAGVSMRITDERISEYLRADCLQTPLPEVREEDEAAVYYTSGSTGTPKGAVLCHRVLVSCAREPDIVPELSERDCFLTFPFFASIVPSVPVFMLLALEKTMFFTTPLEMGSIEQLVECLVRNRVQGIGGTPSFLLRAIGHPAFAKVIKQQVTHLSIGGELLKESDAQKLYDAMENGVISVGYGSTETYLFSFSCYEPGKEIRLERLSEGAKLYVLDEDLKPVPPGETGEILVGGSNAQFGRYLDPELNRKKYVEHPVYGRLFRIGDAGRLLEDGTIKVLGRIDRMIKLHGLRIEPGEVEAAMEAFYGIRRAAVALKKEQLCGYYTAEKEIEESSLRRFLSERLPYYMIPSEIIRMESFPVLGNGKLDYKALPEPEKGEAAGSAPSDDREKLLCRIFGEVLNAEEPVGAEDSFFHLGGDSIHALTVAGRLEKEGFSIELKDLFTAPTPRLLAPLLRVRREDTDGKEIALQVPEEIRRAVAAVMDWEEVETVYPASAVVESYLKNNNSTWPQVYCFEISTDILPEQIETAMQEVSRNHTALRSLILPAGNGHFCQVVLKTPRSQFFRTDLSALFEGEGLSQKQKEYLSTLIRMEYSPQTELGKKTLLRVGYIRISKDKALLYIGSSHLTMEVISVERIFRELTGQVESRPDTEKMNRHMARLLLADRSGAQAYWRKLLEGCDSYTMLPNKPASSGKGKSELVYSGCGKRLFENSQSFCRTHQITLSALLGYCFGKSLMKILSLEEVCFQMAGSGRSVSEMDLPGMFVVCFPLRITKTDTVFTCQRQLLMSGEHAWIWADPDFSPLKGKTLFLRTSHSDNSAEQQQQKLYSEVLGSQQINEVLDGYNISGEVAVGIRAETAHELSWSMLFDSGYYDPQMIRNLSAEWIRQIKECIGEI